MGGGEKIRDCRNIIRSFHCYPLDRQHAASEAVPPSQTVSYRRTQSQGAYSRELQAPE